MSLDERAVTERDGGLSYYDASGERRAAFGLTKDGQAGLSFSASRKLGTSRWQSGKMATST